MKITRRQIISLIQEAMNFGEKLGVSNLGEKGVTDGQPLVRGGGGTGSFYKVTGENIALSRKNKFIDGAVVIGALYRGLLYGLGQKYNLSENDIKETVEINKKYTAYYAVEVKSFADTDGGFIQDKIANVKVISRELLDKFSEFYSNEVVYMQEKDKEYADKVFLTAEESYKLGKKLIERGMKSKLDMNTVLRNNREYKKKKQ